MAIGEKVESLEDEALLTLLSNAKRLSNGTVSARQKEALQLLPLIEAEVATRSLSTTTRKRAKAPATAGK